MSNVVKLSSYSIVVLIFVIIMWIITEWLLVYNLSILYKICTYSRLNKYVNNLFYEDCGGVGSGPLVMPMIDTFNKNH